MPRDCELLAAAVRGGIPRCVVLTANDVDVLVDGAREESIDAVLLCTAGPWQEVVSRLQQARRESGRAFEVVLLLPQCSPLDTALAVSAGADHVAQLTDDVAQWLGPCVQACLDRARARPHGASTTRPEPAAAATWSRLASIVESTTDMVGTAHADGRILSINRAGRILLGLGEDDDVSAFSFAEFHTPRALERLRHEAVPEAVRTGSWSGESTLRSRSGREIPVSQVVLAHRAADGAVEFLSTIARDVTSQKRHEQELADREARTQAILESAVDGILTIDERGTIDMVNSAVQSLFGYTAAELLGNNVGMLMPDPDRSEHDGHIRRFLRTGEPRIVGVGREVSARRADGSPIPVRLAVSEFRVGDRVGFAGILHDLSEERRAEAAEELRRQRFRAIIENVPVLLALLDEEGRAVLVNQHWETTLGMDAERSAAGDLLSTLHPDPVARAAALDLARAPAGTWAEIRTRSRDGGDLDVLWARVSLDDGTSIAIGQDVTERNLLELQYLQAQKMEAVGCLAAGVAHDFNNFLAVVLGYAGLLMESLPADDKSQQWVEQIAHAGRRATVLTRQLLAFGRKSIVAPRILDLNVQMEDVGTILRRLIGEDVEFTVVPGADLGRVVADPGQIEQVLMNLVVNARDAMPRGGRLVVETANVDLDEDYTRTHVGRAGRFVRLAVTDTGHGMDEATRRRIFEPFFTTKPAGKGTGLGLSTVYAIVEQCGGQVEVYSEVGQGTTFKIYLPRVDAPRDAVEDVADLAATGTECGKILVVEDDNLTRGLVQEILTRAGYHVVAVRDGVEALTSFEDSPDAFDAVVTDVVLPRLDGASLAKRLQAIRADLPVVFTSGYAPEAIMARADLAILGPVLAKPFTAAALVRAIREARRARGPAPGGTA